MDPHLSTTSPGGSRARVAPGPSSSRPPTASSTCRPGRSVVLAGVASPYRDALAGGARAVRLEAHAVPAEGPTAREPEAAPVLCVAALPVRGAEGAERVARLRRELGAPLVALAERPDVERAVSWVRAGAADVIPLPDEAERVAWRSLAHRLREHAPSPGAAAVDGLVGRGVSMQRVRSRLARLAECATTVLLSGETGTGKGEAARALHRAGPAPQAPFVHVDCAALAPSVIESELFGHERGAFTGACGRRRGRLEEAAEGTLFLDEIGELPVPLQAKLLRALQDRVFERVGGSETLPLRARVVAATNLDLEAAVTERRFRADLLYRLDVARIALPPLRERLEDLPELVEHGLERLATRLGVPEPTVTDDLLDALAARRWPGNVRELLNALERLLVFGGTDRLDARHLRLADEERGAPRPVCAASEGEGEAERIARVLRETGGNVARAARRLGLARSTLRGRIARHGLEGLRPRD